MTFSFIRSCCFRRRLPFQSHLHFIHTKSTHFATFAFVACKTFVIFPHLHLLACLKPTLHLHLHFSFFRIAPLHSYLHLQLRFSRIFNFMEICKCKFNANAIFKWPHPCHKPTLTLWNILKFIDLCILLGCDYCDSIKGIGPKKAVELINKHKCIEKIIDNLDKSVRVHAICFRFC